MNKFLFAAAATSLVIAAPAFAGDKERAFTHEGANYVYTTTAQDDAVVLEGKSSEGGKFRFVVRDGWVSGYAGAVRVSFRAPKRVSGAKAVVVAAR